MNTLGFLEKQFSRELDEADAVVLGVPFDLTTTGRAGARAGPDGIRQASWHISWQKRHWPWKFDLSDRLRVIDFGDVEFDAGDTGQMVAALQQRAREILAADRRLLCLGGDHFIALPLLREHAARHGPLGLIHFDAHADAEPIAGVVHHGNMFRQALDEGLVDGARTVQVGIRTEYDYEKHPFGVLDGDWVALRTGEQTAAAIRDVVGDAPAYLSFDIDYLDPAFAPGTGTPAVGGPSTAHALATLRALAGCRVVGADVVEVAPAYDHAEITSTAAAQIALEILYLFASAPTMRA